MIISDNIINTTLTVSCYIFIQSNLLCFHRLPDIVQNEVGSYLIELVISLATKDELSELHGQIFKGNLIYFAVHPIANYVLQKFLSVVVDPLVVRHNILWILSDVVFDLPGCIQTETGIFRKPALLQLRVVSDHFSVQILLCL